jgi:hypothetical protein
MYMKKSKSGYKSRYLISQHGPSTQLHLMTIFIKIIFLFNQMIVEIDTHMKLIE